MNINDTTKVEETNPPTIEELQEQVANLQQQIIQGQNIVATLKEALVKQAVKL